MLQSLHPLCHLCWACSRGFVSLLDWGTHNYIFVFHESKDDVGHGFLYFLNSAWDSCLLIQRTSDLDTSSRDFFLLIFIYMHKFWIVSMGFCFCLKLENLNCDVVWGPTLKLLTLFCHSLKYELLGKTQQYCLRIENFYLIKIAYINSIFLRSM